MNESPSDWGVACQHSDFIDRDNKGKKFWALATERHQREEIEELEKEKCKLKK